MSEEQPVLFAHSAAGCAPGPSWQLLEDHSRAVAALACGFSDEWGAGEWGFLAGLLHDLGKAADDWQEFIRSAESDAAGSTTDGEDEP